MTLHMWRMKCDTWWGVNILSKCQLPSFYEDLEEKDDSLNQLMNELITRLFIEQPRLHGVC